MRWLTRALLLTTAFAAPIAVGSAARADPSGPARPLLLWLETLRLGDVGRMAQQTRLPFVVAGFYVQLGKDCDQTVVPNLTAKAVVFTTSMLRMDAANPLKLTRGFRCLLQDTMLREYLPILEAGGWPAGPDANGNSGKVAPITKQKVAKGLRRFAPQIQELAKSHALVQAVWTDNNGVTVTALGAVANDDAGEPKLAAVFLYELFED